MFVEVQFPEQLAYGMTGGPGFSTDIVTAIGGEETRNANWARSRARWEAGVQHRSQADTEALVAFFYSVAVGQANAFRFKDPLDFTFTDQAIGTGNGTTTTFALVKTYSMGGQTYTRLLQKPVAGTVAITLAGVPAVGFTVNTATGVVTITPAPAPGVAVLASGEFDVPVRLAVDSLEGLQYVSVDAWSWQGIALLEVRLNAGGEG